MAGVLPHGSEIEVKNVKIENLKKGDIIAVRVEDRLVTHRFYGIVSLHGKDFLLCKGDKYKRPDPLWEVSALAGVVVSCKAGDMERKVNTGLCRQLSAFVYFVMWKIWFKLFFAENRILVIRMGQLFEIYPELPEDTVSLSHAFENSLMNENTESLSGKIEIKITNKLQDELSSLDADFVSDKISLVMQEEGRVEIVKTETVNVVNAVESAFRFAAIKYADENGGTCIHASSVLLNDKAIIFAGPSGTGKTTCSEKFAMEERLDDDLVLIVKKDKKYYRQSWSPFSKTGNLSEVKAIFLPVKAESFSVRKAEPKETLKYIFNLPPEGMSEQYKERLFNNCCDMLEVVPAYFVEWNKADDLKSKVNEFGELS
jgi:hypothetical protein